MTKTHAAIAVMIALVLCVAAFLVVGMAAHSAPRYHTRGICISYNTTGGCADWGTLTEGN